MSDLEILDERNFLTKESLAQIIENYVLTEEMNHFEAVIAFCEENNREFEDIVRMFGPTLMEKVKQASRDMGLMPQDSTIEGL